MTSQGSHTFLHSWNWGAFNKSIGEKVWWLGLYDDDKLIAVSLLIKIHAKRGNFLFVPHGPIVSREMNKEILSTLIKEFKKIAKKERANFIRIGPLLEDTAANRRIFKELGFRNAPIYIHAETVWTLNLEPPEEELLQGMRKTTRNLIRRAKKEGVTVEQGNSKDAIKIFNTIYKETAARHTFVPFSLEYLENQVASFACDDQIQTFVAWYGGKPIAAAIVVFYGNSAFYHHGASSQKFSKIPATYLLQWEAIREAKRRGHKFYNFWGIIPNQTVNGRKKHPWWGITLFKKGFGGFQTNYVRTQDMPLSWRYWPNYVLETMRRWHRLHR